MGRSRFPGGIKPCHASDITNMTDGHRVMKVGWSRTNYSVRLRFEFEICDKEEGKTCRKEIFRAVSDPFEIFSNVYQISSLVQGWRCM